MKPHRPSAFADAVPVDGRGQRTPATLLLLDERDNLLREAAKFYPGLSQREAARLIRIALLRYRDGRWRRDRSEATYPVQHQGKLTALLYALLRRRDAVPSAMTIRRAIAFRDPARVQSCGHHDAMEASNDI